MLTGCPPSLFPEAERRANCATRPCWSLCASHLNSLPFDILKMNGSFTRNLRNARGRVSLTVDGTRHRLEERDAFLYLVLSRPDSGL